MEQRSQAWHYQAGTDWRFGERTEPIGQIHSTVPTRPRPDGARRQLPDDEGRRRRDERNRSERNPPPPRGPRGPVDDYA